VFSCDAARSFYGEHRNQFFTDSLSTFNQVDKKIVRTEIGVLLRLSHPNIVSLALFFLSTFFSLKKKKFFLFLRDYCCGSPIQTCETPGLELWVLLMTTLAADYGRLLNYTYTLK